MQVSLPFLTFCFCCVVVQFTAHANIVEQYCRYITALCIVVRIEEILLFSSIIILPPLFLLKTRIHNLSFFTSILFVMAFFVNFWIYSIYGIFIALNLWQRMASLDTKWRTTTCIVHCATTSVERKLLMCECAHCIALWSITPSYTYLLIIAHLCICFCIVFWCWGYS